MLSKGDFRYMWLPAQLFCAAAAAAADLCGGHPPAARARLLLNARSMAKHLSVGNCNLLGGPDAPLVHWRSGAKLLAGLDADLKQPYRGRSLPGPVSRV